MTEYVPVPVHAAKSLAETFRKSIVVILSLDRDHDLVNTTTYGKSARDKLVAAQWGETCAAAIGCDPTKKDYSEDFRNDPDGLLAAQFREATELLHDIYRRNACEPWHAQRVERFLKSIGVGSMREA